MEEREQNAIQRGPHLSPPRSSDETEGTANGTFNSQPPQTFVPSSGDETGGTRMEPSTEQSKRSLEKNISFFRENNHAYSAHVETLDTYQNIRDSTNQALAG